MKWPLCHFATIRSAVAQRLHQPLPDVLDVSDEIIERPYSHVGYVEFCVPEDAIVDSKSITDDSDEPWPVAIDLILLEDLISVLWGVEVLAIGAELGNNLVYRACEPLPIWLSGEEIRTRLFLYQGCPINWLKPAP